MKVLWMHVDPDLAGPLMAMVTTMLGAMTGSEMQSRLLEQNRLSGANRNTLIAGGIMANTAEIFNFRCRMRHKRSRAWQISMMVIRALQMSCWKL